MATSARGRSETMLVTRVRDGRQWREPDEIVVEEPMSIQLDGVLVSTTMRTPGHDFELAVGFCHTEGLLHGAPITAVRYCADGSALASAFNVVTVETGGRAPTPTARLGNTSTSCGLCGNEAIDQLAARLEPLPPHGMGRFHPTLLAEFQPQQALFDATGGVHAAAAFTTDGTAIVTREDVGRHNAVDKVIGHLLLDGTVQTNELALFVSGRASFEMVQKAWAAGFAALVAVSAPTALAVHTARRANLMLAGFVRGSRINVYSPERLA